MIRVRELRFWTALAVIALGLLTLSKAKTLLAYAVAERAAEPRSADASLEPFVGDPTVGPRALARMLEADRLEAPDRRSERLKALLSVAPLTGGAWLELARAWMDGGESKEKVVSALVMSNLAAPNEGGVMARRAVFGLPLWPILPPEARKSLIADLVGGWANVSDSDRTALKAVLKLASDATREEMRAALLLSGQPGVRIALLLVHDNPVAATPCRSHAEAPCP